MNFFQKLTRNPFDPIKDLMNKITVCVGHIEPMVKASFEGEFDVVVQHFKNITVAEHEADIIKHSIRDNIPKSLFMPIDRWHFMDIISSADKIADRVEDLGYMLTIRQTRIPEQLRPDFEELLYKSLECYNLLASVVENLDTLIEVGFTGPVAEDMNKQIHQVGHLEWETDKVKYTLSQHLFQLEKELSPIDIIMLHDISHIFGQFADSVEKLAKHIRRMITH